MDKHNVRFVKYSQREVDFILYKWSLINDEVRQPNNLSYLNNFFEHCLNSKSKMIDPIYLERRKSLINDELIGWFKDDLRAGLFLYTYLHFRHKHLNLDLQIYDNFLKDLVVSIDCVSKENTIQDIRLFTYAHKMFAIRHASLFYKNYKTKSKYLSWLHRNDKEQIDWAIEYLQELNLLIQPFNFLSTDNTERYMQICASIDALDLHTDLSIKIIRNTNSKKNDNVDNLANDISEEESRLAFKDQDLHPNSRNIPSQQSKLNAVYNVKDLPINSFNKSDPFHAGAKNSEHKEKLLSNMRNAWNQKVFRDKKSVVPERKMKLPHGYNKKLEQIAEAYGSNAVDSLKQILDEEYDKAVLSK